jgi:hypothetical protein
VLQHALAPPDDEAELVLGVAQSETVPDGFARAVVLFVGVDVENAVQLAVY